MEDLIFLELLSNQPIFECETHENKKIYVGTLIINADRYRIKIEETKTDKGVRMKLVDLNGNLDKFKDKLEDLSIMNGCNITTYVSKLEEIIRKHSYYPKNQTSIYRKVLLEYSEFIKFFIDLKSSSLTPDLTSINVAVYDENRREHNVEYGVDYNESIDIFHFKEYDLPENRNKTLDKKSSSLLDLHNIFLGYIESLQPYFDLMDLIDGNSHVIDPKTRLKKHNYRRISLGDNIWVIITIDPFSVYTLPQFAFLGSERLIQTFRQKLNENLDKWDDGGDIFQEILNILGLEQFPCPTQQSVMTQNTHEILLKEDSDCSICFSSDLDGKLPEIVCNNECCGNMYHKECLYQWLLSINSIKISNEINGPCPNCEKIISCPILE